MSETELGVEEQIAKLEELLAWFESEEVNLDEAIKKYQEAQKLSETISKQLTAAKNKIEILKNQNS